MDCSSVSEVHPSPDTSTELAVFFVSFASWRFDFFWLWPLLAFGGVSRIKTLQDSWMSCPNLADPVVGKIGMLHQGFAGHMAGHAILS